MKTKALFFACILCIVTLLSSCKQFDNKEVNKNPLLGTSWVLQQNDSLKIIKVFSDKLFVVYQKNKKNIVVTQHAGTYSVQGDTITERTLHTTPNRSKWIGMHTEIAFILADNKLTASGKIISPKLGEFAEEWTRLDSETQLEN